MVLTVLFLFYLLLLYINPTASIVSKKAAENINALVLDTKFGKAAFMQTMEEGRELAQNMVLKFRFFNEFEFGKIGTGPIWGQFHRGVQQKILLRKCICLAKQS